VQYAEHRRIRPDAERQRDHCNDGETTTVSQSAQSEPQIKRENPEMGSQPCAAEAAWRWAAFCLCRHLMKRVVGALEYAHWVYLQEDRIRCPGMIATAELRNDRNSLLAIQ
jgi:hypothetical protein